MHTDDKKKLEGFTEDERAAMKARAKELLNEAKSEKNRAAGEQAVQDAIAGMTEPDKGLAIKLHDLITKNFPQLMPKTWYGFPAYSKDDKVICFFQFAGKFKSRYGTLGFSDSAMLDEGNIWPVAFALRQITSVEEKKILELVKKAIS